MADKKNGKILVIKIGTAVLTDANGCLDEGIIKSVCEQVDRIKRRGLGIALVSSGAIVVGMQLLGLAKRPEYLPDIQAAAAVGQAQLIKIYDHYLRKSGIMAAQILLTQEDISDRTRYLNARNTLLTLLGRGIVPIINENDTVSTEEIKLGDNDRLSSLVANLIEADKLIIMSVVDGLFRRHGRDRSKSQLISRVERITEDIEALAEDECSRFGVGGMSTKLQAAKMAQDAGIECAIVNGKREGILIDYLDGKAVGTVFVASAPTVSARKRWIAYSSKAAGRIKVDDGARDALLKKNRSLLPSGVIECSGRFHVGDAVSITGPDNAEFARGITNYSFLELNKIKGKKTTEIEKILGYKYYDEVVHRDNLVII